MFPFFCVNHQNMFKTKFLFIMTILWLNWKYPYKQCVGLLWSAILIWSVWSLNLLFTIISDTHVSANWIGMNQHMRKILPSLPLLSCSVRIHNNNTAQNRWRGREGCYERTHISHVEWKSSPGLAVVPCK